MSLKDFQTISNVSDITEVIEPFNFQSSSFNLNFGKSKKLYESKNKKTSPSKEKKDIKYNNTPKFKTTKYNFFRKFDKPGMNIIEISNQIKKRYPSTLISSSETMTNKDYKSILHEDIAYSKRNDEETKLMLLHKIRMDNPKHSFSVFNSDLNKFTLQQRKNQDYTKYCKQQITF